MWPGRLWYTVRYDNTLQRKGLPWNQISYCSPISIILLPNIKLVSCKALITVAHTTAQRRYQFPINLILYSVYDISIADATLLTATHWIFSLFTNARLGGQIRHNGFHTSSLVYCFVNPIVFLAMNRDRKIDTMCVHTVPSVSQWCLMLYLWKCTNAQTIITIWVLVNDSREVPCAEWRAASLMYLALLIVTKFSTNFLVNLMQGSKRFHPQTPQRQQCTNSKAGEFGRNSHPNLQARYAFQNIWEIYPMCTGRPCCKPCGRILEWIGP